MVDKVTISFEISTCRQPVIKFEKFKFFPLPPTLGTAFFKATKGKLKRLRKSAKKWTQEHQVGLQGHNVLAEGPATTLRLAGYGRALLLLNRLCQSQQKARAREE